MKKTHSVGIALSLEKEIMRVEKELFDISANYNSSQKGSSCKEYSLEEEQKIQDIGDKFIYLEAIYFDLIDKLCFYILRRYMAGKALKKEYDPIIENVFRNLQKRQKDKDYKNIYEYAKRHKLLI